MLMLWKKEAKMVFVNEARPITRTGCGTIGYINNQPALWQKPIEGKGEHLVKFGDYLDEILCLKPNNISYYDYVVTRRTCQKGNQLLWQNKESVSLFIEPEEIPKISNEKLQKEAKIEKITKHGRELRYAESENDYWPESDYCFLGKVGWWWGTRWEYFHFPKMTEELRIISELQAL